MAFHEEISGESSSFHSIAKQVPVKISELYRPPRKVTVSSGVLQRKHAEDFSSLYDFSLEKSIVDKMGQMKLLRSQDKQKQKKSQAAYQQAKELELFNQVTHLETTTEQENELPEEQRSHESITKEFKDADKEHAVDNPPPSNPSVPPPVSQSSVMSPPPHPIGPHISHPRNSPVLSPVPFVHSPPNGATQTPSRSPVSFSTNVQPVHYVSNDSTSDSSNNYQTQSTASHLTHNTHAGIYNNVPHFYPGNSNSTNNVPYSINPISAPMLDSYSYPNSSVGNMSNISQYNFSVSTSHPMSSVPPGPPASTNISLGNYYSSAPQSSYVSTISSLASPVVHAGLIPGNSPQVYAPQYTSVLQPTHLLDDAHNMAVIKEKQKVNVKDFEQDTSSPFDSCELKSINDMEELRHVLEHCVMKQEQLQQQQRLQQYQQQVQQSQHQSLLQQHRQERQYGVRYTPQYSQGYEVQYGVPGSGQSHLYQPPHNTDQDHHPAAHNPLHSQYLPPSQSVYDNQTFPPQNQPSQSTGQTFPSQNPSQPLENTIPAQNQLFQPTGQNVAPKNSKGSAHISTSHDQHSQSLRYNPPTDPFSNSKPLPNIHSSPSNQPFNSLPLNNPYQKVPSNIQHTQFSNHSPDLNPQPPLSSHSSGHFSCNSTSGHVQNIQNTHLTNRNPNLDQPSHVQNTQNTQFSNHNPNLGQPSQLPLPSQPSEHLSEQHHSSSGFVESVPAQRVSSVLTELRDELMKRREIDEQSEAALRSPPPEEPTPESFYDTPLPPMQVSYLPNPYLSLSPALQTQVDRIVEMGFLQSRSARALQALGPREEKVIEFLIQVLALEEKFPALSGTDLCEEALAHHQSNVSATEAFLGAVTKLSRLGFPACRVARVLRDVNGDEEKALDALVS